ncbi:MAG: hypothetical protein ACKPKO_20050, partial [Candidatus Fonsibacter sp.]
MPANSRTAKAAVEAGKQYQVAVKADKGKKGGHGQPLLWTCGAILASVAQVAQGTEKEDMARIMGLHKSGPQSLQRVVTFCMCREVH